MTGLLPQAHSENTNSYTEKNVVFCWVSMCFPKEAHLVIQMNHYVINREILWLYLNMIFP